MKKCTGVLGTLSNFSTIPSFSWCTERTHGASIEKKDGDEMMDGMDNNPGGIASCTH